MRACIHRGAAEIGGSCVEVQHDGHTVVLDVGRPLEFGFRDDVPIPDVEAFRVDSPRRVAVLLSHGHPDHYGLIPGIPPGIPVYLGEATQRILKEAAFFSPAGAEIEAAGYLRDRQPIRLGPFIITPFLVDHSAFDSYGLLVEAGGRRLLYSGDIRASGRKAKVFEHFLAHPPGNVDVLLLEGTNVRTEDPSVPSLTERDVEDLCVELFLRTDGMVLACYSGQNIDRMVTLHRAARRAGRNLVLDLYGAAIARATGRPDTIPQGDWDSVHVYVPQSQRVLVKQARQFERTAQVRSRRLYPQDLASRAGDLVMTFRSSMRHEMHRAGCLDGAQAVWSMWAGYLEQRSGERLLAWFEEHGIPLSILHASGHASPDDLQRYAAAVSAREVVPIHTLHAERFHELFDNVQMREDGAWWTV